MIKDLFETQKKLMYQFEKKHPSQPGENRFNNKVLGCLVEVGEAANELRTWKYWSLDRKPRTNKLLEELVDVLHFTLELGIILDVILYANEIQPHKCDSIEEQFIALYNHILSTSLDEVFYLDLLNTYVGLIEMVGFSWDEVEKAYFEKVEINYGRLENGY
jgi:dimeric dUTPase (all-alpha-NTP-PPase superfamily)